MRYNDAIYLISESVVYDDLGISKKITDENLVFANKYQVSTSEFYSDNMRTDSSTHTIRNKTAFMIRFDSYNNEKKYRYNNVEYEILRVSDQGEYIHLVGGEKIGKR